MRTTVLLVCLAASAALAQQPQVVTTSSQSQTQAPPKGTAVLSGQVVDAGGAGVAGVAVTLQGGYEMMGLVPTQRSLPGGSRSTLTNNDGHFAFFELPAGSYSIDAAKSGFMPGAFGRVRPRGQPQSVDVRDGETNAQIRIRIWGFSAVTGSVRDEAGEAVVGVQVRALRRSANGKRQVLVPGGSAMTDDRGEYRIDMLQPGEYVVGIQTLQATLPAAVVQAVAAGRAAGAVGELMSQLSRAGVSGSGNVTTSAKSIGEWAWSSGGRTALTVPSPANDGRLFVYPTTFYPSARTSREAQTIVVRSGEDRSAIDFQLQLAPATIVTGTVIASDGPMAGLPIRLVPEDIDDYDGDLRGQEAAITVSDANGRFLFAGVTPGSYVLQAQALPTSVVGPANPSMRGQWANQALAVGEAGIQNMTLTLRNGARVSGRIEFDGARPRPGPEVVSHLFIQLEPLEANVNRSSSSYMVNFDGNGAFTIPEVPPGRYLVVFRAYAEDRRGMAGWETKVATLGGRDVSTRPMIVQGDITNLVMTLTDHNSEVSGTVRDASGKADADASVLVFTAERELWPDATTNNRRFRQMRAAENGTFTLRGVLPGEYFIVAIADEDVTDWPDSRAFDALSKIATRFMIADSGKVMQDLTTRRVR